MAARGRLTVAAILVAAGDGLRLGAHVPKAFVPIASRTLLEHAAVRFVDHSLVRDVIVVAPAALVDVAHALVPSARAVSGGRTRQESVSRGIAALAQDVDAVLVHDVARPFVTAEAITRVLDALEAGALAVIPALPVVDTIKEVDADSVVTRTLERGSLRAVQTPQGFRRDVLVAAHSSAGHGAAVDDATLAERNGVSVLVVPGAPEALKITSPHDLAWAEWMARR